MSKTDSVQTKTNALSQLDIVATAVHELKTPLSLIAGLSSMLKNGELGKVDKAQARYLGKIEYSSDRLLRIAEGIIAMDRYLKDTDTMNLEAVRVDSVARLVIAELEPMASQHYQEVELRCKKNIPTILANAQAVYQVLFNLLDNALKYSGAKTKIVITLRMRAEHLQIAVRDKGAGISSRDLRQLFRRYGNSPQPVNKWPGSSGLGLYIVKTFVDLHRGSIDAKPMARGTEFRVELPTSQQLSLFDSEA